MKTNTKIEEFYLSIDPDLEEKISKKKAYEYYKDELFKKEKIGSVTHLKNIHEHLFRDIYGEFAGLIRNHDISKGNTIFCKAIYLIENLKIVENMKQDSFEDIINKYVEMNMMHPFYEGNGRATRIWLDNILITKLNKAIDWTKVPKNLYLNCMKDSVLDSKNLQYLLESALTNKIKNREFYMKGIDASYEYENLSNYKTKKIIQKDIDQKLTLKR